MHSLRPLACALLLAALLPPLAHAQGEIPPQYRGTSTAIARGILDGNLIETNFRNHGEMSRFGDLPHGVWPRGVGGRHIDGVGIVVSGIVEGERAKWGLAPTDTLLNPVIIHYREAGRRTGPRSDIWGWLPLPGFNNPNRLDPITGQRTPTPALSDDPASWPAFWPDRLDNPDDPGWRYDEVDNNPNVAGWNGLFGKGVFNADLESFYVIDDLNDREYALDPSGQPYSPFGVFYPDPADSTKGGLGLQVQVRLLQWANILSEDVMFILYRVANIGATRHDQLFFSQVMDYGLGQEEGDENAAFDPQEDVAYGWDQDGLCQRATGGQYECGYTGFAFLESPAMPDDGVDNDEDGITDEDRFSGPGQLIEGQQAIRDYVLANYDAGNFAAFNSVGDVQSTFEEALAGRPAFQAGRWWTGDENLDWVGYVDANENGQFDSGETINSDVGLDGLGPNSLGYPGPDTGEADGIPTPGEPNFDRLDVDESDQIGLTGFDLDTRPFYETGDNLRSDTWLFERIIENQFPVGTEPAEERVDIEPFLLFNSGPTSLLPQRTDPDRSVDFFSTAWIYGEDERDFFKNRRTVQSIYNADYQFAQPPFTPTLRAVAGDGRVVLTWDDVALRSFDTFSQSFDFEGFKLYRGTDPILSDSRTVTDAFGAAVFYEPIAQFDLENGIRGTTNALEGDARYYLGDDTGLQYFYVDDDVRNGFTYYYALVAYDRGFTDPDDPSIPSIEPQENVFNFSTDLAGQVRGTSINAAVVTPRAPAAGFVAGGAVEDLSSVSTGIGTGSIQVQVFDESALSADDVYQVRFFSQPAEDGELYETTAYTLENVTTGEVLLDSLQLERTSRTVDGLGFFVEFDNDSETRTLPDRTGYVAEAEGRETFSVDPRTLDSVASNWVARISEGSSEDYAVSPYDYELVWVDPSDSLYTPPRFRLSEFLREDIPVFAYNRTLGTQADLLVDDVNGSGTFDVGDALIVNEAFGRTDRRFRYRVGFAPTGEAPSDPPDAGDRLRISVQRPFATGDAFQFTLRAARIDAEAATAGLDQIRVVPNPYVAAAAWERGSPQITGRGERKIYFTHLPRQCTVRIYNVRGELIRTLYHDSVADDGQLDWDLRSDENSDIAYGVYVFHVDAPGVGEHVGRFSVIK